MRVAGRRRVVQSSIFMFLEQVALGWILEILRLPAESGGAFVTGATVANFSALAAARHAVPGPPFDLVLYDKGHYELHSTSRTA